MKRKEIVYKIKDMIEECGQDMQEADENVSSTWPQTEVHFDEKKILIQKTECSDTLKDMLGDKLTDARKEIGKWEIVIIKKTN
jgi:hypothetical protein